MTTNKLKLNKQFVEPSNSLAPKLKPVMLRPLGKFERALYISNTYAPFNIVAMLELKSPPPPNVVGDALLSLQKRHPFLRARIEVKDGIPSLVETDPQALPIVFINGMDGSWERIVEEELNRRVDSSGGALFRCIYRYNDSNAELFLTLQHTIVDGASMAHLLHELLTQCANPLNSLPPLEPIPAVETFFPPSTRGLKGFIHTLGYIQRQIADEIHYQLVTRKDRQPAVRFGGHLHVACMSLDSALVDALSYRARREKVTLNSLIQAATLQAVNRHLYQGEPTLMRTFAFPDLRLYVSPPLETENLGACISMLRYTLTVSGDMPVWRLAREVNKTLEKSFRRGEKFTANLMSESLMKLFTTTKMMRMGANGVSYGGVSEVQRHYGNIYVSAFHGFIANIDLGCELATQASLFDDELVLDLTYLDSDMDQAKARQVAGEIRSILEKAII